MLVILVLAVMLWTSARSQKPFSDLYTEDVASASVQITPPGISIALEEDEIEEMVELLQDVVVYQRDSASYVGQQSATFSVIKTTGSIMEVTITSTVIGIDGDYYRAEEASCEALTQFANNLET